MDLLFCWDGWRAHDFTVVLQGIVALIITRDRGMKINRNESGGDLALCSRHPWLHLPEAKLDVMWLSWLISPSSPTFLFIHLMMTHPSVVWILAWLGLYWRARPGTVHWKAHGAWVSTMPQLLQLALPRALALTRCLWQQRLGRVHGRAREKKRENERKAKC